MRRIRKNSSFVAAHFVRQQCDRCPGQSKRVQNYTWKYDLYLTAGSSTHDETITIQDVPWRTPIPHSEEVRQRKEACQHVNAEPPKDPRGSSMYGNSPSAVMACLSAPLKSRFELGSQDLCSITKEIPSPEGLCLSFAQLCMQMEIQDMALTFYDSESAAINEAFSTT